jgi:hypothetical protein
VADISDALRRRDDATHAVIILEMTDNWLDGGAALELSLHLFGDASLLAGGVDSEPVLGRGIVAAIAGISNNAIGPLCSDR